MENQEFNKLLVNNKLFDFGEYILLNSHMFDANDVKSFIELIIKLQNSLTSH